MKTIRTDYTDATAGDFYQDRPSLNLNTVLNYFTTRPVKFQMYEGAAIIQEVQFPDVSFWQEEINFSIMRLQTNAVIVRIGQNRWPDDEFGRNYLEAKKNGMLVGGYWFYDDRISPREQAELLVELCLGKVFDLEIFIDWENTYGGEFSALRNVVAMMQLLDMAVEMGLLKTKNIGFYTGYYWFRGNSNSVSNAGQYNYLKTKPLWLAWYTTSPAQVLIPAPWTELDLWQWGTPAWNWGQKSKEIDMNFWNGTKEEFEAYYGSVPGEEVPMSDYIELKPNTAVSRSIRQQTAYPQTPHIMGTKIGQINAGSLGKALPGDKYVYASNISSGGITMAFAGDIWWRVYEANGVGIAGWVAERHLGQVLLTVRSVVTAPIPPMSLPDLPVTITLGDDVTYAKQTIEIVLKPK